MLRQELEFTGDQMIQGQYYAAHLVPVCLHGYLSIIVKSHTIAIEGK